MRLHTAEKSKRKSKTLAMVKKTIIHAILLLSLPFAAQWFLRSTWIFPLKIKTTSMAPTIQNGDTLFFLYAHLTTLKREDVIVSIHSEEAPLLCRIIGTEGEKVEIIDRTVYINDEPMAYFQESTIDRAIYPRQDSNRDNLPPLHLRPGHFFCLNDNWDNSLDSRFYGPIPYESVRGKAIFHNLLGFSL